MPAETSFDRTILHRATKFLAAAAAVFVVCELVRPWLGSSSVIAVRYLGAIVAGLATGALGFSFMFLAIALAAAGSLGSKSLIHRGVSPNTIRNVVLAAISMLVLGLFFFLPFCLGSSRDGTYDCIPLVTRLTDALG